MIKTGDIFALGNHRLMCGDSGNPDHVAMLMAGAKADLVFTSPPYAQQRQYVRGVDDWDALMQRVFGALPANEKTQVLVNLGLVHRKGEWQPYWDHWIEWMRTQGWRRFGWYVWDKQFAVPCGERGRFQCCHEWIFHFNKISRITNRTQISKTAGRKTSGGQRKKNGSVVTLWCSGAPVNNTKIADSVIRMLPEMRRGIGHPAVFPVALPVEVIKAYTNPGEILYDPFAGSGTSILAAEQEGRTCYAMEIEPNYVDIALQRLSKAGLVAS